MIGGVFNPDRAGLWLPVPGSNAVPVALGYPALTVAGATLTARAPALTSRFTRAARLGFVSAAAAGSVLSLRHAAATIATGGSGLGGFRAAYRFGISDVAAVATARMFLGISASTAALTNVAPGSLTNCIGVGHDAGDTTLRVYSGGSSAQTPIVTGIPVTRNDSIYEFTLTAPPAEANTVYWSLQVLGSETRATGVLTGDAAVLPQNTVLLNPISAMRTNNATALSVGLDLFMLKLEIPD